MNYTIFTRTCIKQEYTVVIFIFDFFTHIIFFLLFFTVYNNLYKCGESVFCNWKREQKFFICR